MQTTAGTLFFVLAVLVGTAFGIVFMMGGAMSGPPALPTEPVAAVRPPAPEPPARQPIAAVPTGVPTQAVLPPTLVASPTVPPKSAPTAIRPAATPTAVPKPAASGAQGPAPVGQRIVSGGVGLTVNTVTKRPELGEFMKADPGKVYLVADVTIENTGRDVSPYNPLYFKVKDAEGYEVGVGLSMDDRALRSGELAAGEQARGTVAFEVPQTARGFVLSYQPLVLFGGYQIIRVDLGQ